MIPINLSLKNFMSYKSLDLDFSELHVACLSGENGAGKSSILDAMTWSIWEKTRASSNEELVRIGESEMSVELTFQLEDRIYKIIRSTSKAKSRKTSQSSLEFQVMSDKGFKALTGKTIRETQTRIIETVRMNYSTFINSAFILQGKADEFTNKGATDRKKVLAEILDLSFYDELQEKAKNKVKDLDLEKAQIESVLDKNMASINDEELILDKLKISELELFNLEEKLSIINKDLVESSESKENISNKISALNEINKNYLNNKKQLEEINNQLVSVEDLLSKAEKIIQRKEEIESKFNLLTDYRKQQEEISLKLIKHSELEKEINHLKSLITSKKHKIEIELGKQVEKEEQKNRQKLEIEKFLKDKTKIVEGYEKYLALKKEESQYQQRMINNQRLSQEKNELEKQLEREKQTFNIQKEKLKSKIDSNNLLISNSIKIKNKLEEIQQKKDELDKKQTYYNEVLEKGKELKAIIDQNLKVIEDKKLSKNKIIDKAEKWKEVHEPNCPMCNTHLEEEDRKKILNMYLQEIDTIDEEIEKIDLENVNLEKKKKHYLQEYSKTKLELETKPQLERSLGELEVQLKASSEAEVENKSLEIELKNIIEKLEGKSINPELESKLDKLNEELKNNDFSNEKFASIQSDVTSYKWSEIKYSQLEKYETDYGYLLKELPDIENQIRNLNDSIENKLYAQEEYKNLSTKEFELESIGYDKDKHQEVNSKIESIKNFDDHWRSLQNALEKQPHLQEQKDSLLKNKSNLELHISESELKVNDLPILQKELYDLTQKIDNFNIEKNNIRNQENTLRADIVRFTEKLTQYEQMKKDNEEAKTKLEDIEYEINLHKELINAFGRKGIQAVIIENAIPEIEMYANKLLTRMTEGRMHVRFSTLKANKSNDKMSETLDIEISDELGTRSYEMYSGGESFRVNFAIRLALSKMLARRSGTKLKTMVIDEGFGTQDSKGISRLVEAINTVSDDFEKILIITHISELKEAFPAKIEVYKTINGSQIRLFT